MKKTSKNRKKFESKMQKRARNLLLGIAGSMAIGCLLYRSEYKKYKPMTDNNSLERNIAEPRQKYIDSLISTNEIPYCLGVIYDSDGSKIAEYINSEIEIKKQCLPHPKGRGLQRACFLDAR